ncbi:hypothetical protein NDU88_004509 [Pleurodeles waltl]|uniref:Uncharacterized protein n=1 Tax=Pleurodeles waltl TaxID=8319 RepID=A0AAV7QIJ9_PLEWA|nr:hypothetical protein NDU88_004509 [Pleurodeles waltl]
MGLKELRDDLRYSRCKEGPRYRIERSTWGGSPPRAHRNGQLEQNPALGPRGQVEDPVREEPGEEERGPEACLALAAPPRGIGGPGDWGCLALGQAGPGHPLEWPAGAGARPGPPGRSAVPGATGWPAPPPPPRKQRAPLELEPDWKPHGREGGPVSGGAGTREDRLTEASPPLCSGGPGGRGSQALAADVRLTRGDGERKGFKIRPYTMQTRGEKTQKMHKGDMKLGTR